MNSELIRLKLISVIQFWPVMLVVKNGMLSKSNADKVAPDFHYFRRWVCQKI